MKTSALTTWFDWKARSRSSTQFVRFSSVTPGGRGIRSRTPCQESLALARTESKERQRIMACKTANRCREAFGVRGVPALSNGLGRTKAGERPALQTLRDSGSRGSSRKSNMVEANGSGLAKGESQG